MKTNIFGLIKECANTHNYKELIILLRKIWHWPEYVIVRENDLELHTGGWSTNEEIIEALENTSFWYLYWQKSERGGHYYFKLKEKK